ncbi:MAG: [Lentisphaeria bacterium]|nr:[FeFe] hydrogenase H-cluster maturation GTPase HydF [Lentisphaeria bacterium]
ALENMKEPPVLAVTDSQVFGSVSKMVPRSIPLTSFSILLARMKGDLATCAAGARKIAELKDGSKVLIAEACTHHAIADDIGRVKIPNWIREYTGCKNIEFVHQSGPEFPADLRTYDLVIHCGACTFNRKAVLSRILRCQEQGVAFTNYGVAIAFVKGILERTLSPFPELQNVLERKEMEK